MTYYIMQVKAIIIVIKFGEVERYRDKFNILIFFKKTNGDLSDDRNINKETEQRMTLKW